MNKLFLQALRCEPVPRPPVWLMRQAGRYMPPYRALREKHSLWEMFHNAELAAEVTCQPLQHLGVDAAILFSDILVIAEALGLTVQFPAQGGPRVEPAIHTAVQVAELPSLPVDEKLGYVSQTISLVKQQIDVPLIGFCGGPFTVASYLIDSTSKNAFERTKGWIEEDPASLHQLLSKITDASIAYLQLQARAGVDTVQIFDSWANVLSDTDFGAYCLPYLQKIIKAMQTIDMPVIVFCRSSSLRADALANLRPSAISFDWHLPMRKLRDKVPSGIAVQGNFNPEFLKLSHDEITSGVRDLMESMKGERGFIVNLGHGVTPDIPFENVRCFVDAVKQN